MDEIKTKGIVISAKDYKDSDKIVTIFSAEMGLIHARVRGVKKNKAKLVFAVQPFAFVEFVLSARNGFYTVINATSIDQFFAITNDFDNYIFMLACLELCGKTVKENDDQKELFLLLISTLNSVCYAGVKSIYAFIKFMIESLKLLGFKLELQRCVCCDGKLVSSVRAFSYDYFGLLCPKCSNKFDYLELTDGEMKILQLIDLTELSNLSQLKFDSHADLISVIGFLSKLFRLQTDEELISIKKFL